jgi:raffinose/stachyose/melibiose transport system permease protein
VRAARLARRYWVDLVALSIAFLVFIVPFIFIVVTAAKTKAEASSLDFAWPTDWKILENIQAVLSERNGIMITALRNSLVLTVASVTITVILASMIAFVIQRRRDRVAALVSGLFLAGLIIPPAVVPTIFLLQAIGLFKTLAGLILVEVAFGMPFAILVFVAFVSVIPRELDEAALMDGATPFKLYLRVILPLLRPAIITVIVVLSVAIYNDFVNPLYFLPGNDNATVQLTLFNFQSQFNTRWNLLFADVLLITIPPLIMFIFFQRQLASGLTAGAVKG